MEPLTPDDVAEVIVFAAGRRENVVIADTLIYPNHQVCSSLCIRAMSEGNVPSRSRTRYTVPANSLEGCSNGYAQEVNIESWFRTFVQI